MQMKRPIKMHLKRAHSKPKAFILVWIYTTQFKKKQITLYHDRSIRAKYIQQIILKNNPFDNEGM